MTDILGKENARLMGLVHEYEARMRKMVEEYNESIRVKDGQVRMHVAASALNGMIAHGGCYENMETDAVDMADKMLAALRRAQGLDAQAKLAERHDGKRLDEP